MLLQDKMKSFLKSSLGKLKLILLATVVLLGMKYFAHKTVLGEVGHEMLSLRDQITRFQEEKALEEKNLEELKKIELHIVKSINIANAKLSEMQKASLVSILSRVAMMEFYNFEQRELWIAVLANESRFNPQAKSPVGALGIGQVMPGSAVWYGKRCGMENITPTDLMDTQINAMISACIFKVILKSVGGSPSLSLVAYNAGQFSKDINNIDKLTSINNESANYVAKITRFLEKTRAVNILHKKTAEE